MPWIFAARSASPPPSRLGQPTPRGRVRKARGTDPRRYSAQGDDLPGDENRGGAMTDFEVIVAGGGMVGLTLAAALGGAGVTVAVVDRRPASAMLEPVFDGRVSAVAHGSRTVLDAVGVWDGLAGDAEPIREIRVSDGASPLHLHYDSAEVAADALGYIVENRHIRHALLERVRSLGRATLLDGRSIVRHERGPIEARVELEDGSELAARLLIATDGRESPLRRAAGLGTVEWRYDQTGIVCTIAHERPHRGIAQERFLPSGPFAILPMTGNRASIVWTERADVATRVLGLDRDAFADELAWRFTDYLGALDIEGPVFSYPLALTLAERYTANRLAVAGDAAHAIHPIAGQGFNLGIRDAAALAETIVDAARLGIDTGSVAALARYARWRRADNFAMLAATDGLNRLFSNDIAPVALGRRLGLAAVNRIPRLKRLFMRHAMGELGERPRLARGMPL